MKIDQKYIAIANAHKEVRDFFHSKADKDTITHDYYTNFAKWFQNTGRDLSERIRDGKFVDQNARNVTIDHLNVATDLVSTIDRTALVLSLVYDALVVAENMEVENTIPIS